MNMRIKEYSFYPNKTIIGKKIQQLRKEKGYTALLLSEELGYDVKNVNKWEQGRGMPNLHTLKQLTEILEINIDDLILDNKCIITKRWDDLLIKDNLLSPGFGIFFKQFNPNIVEDIFGFRIRKDYLFQKYLDAFLSQEELLEIDILIAHKEMFSREKTMSNKIENIVSLYKNKEFSSIDESLFEIEKLLLDSNELEKLMQLSMWKKTNDIVYDKMFEYLLDYEKDLMFNTILITKETDKYDLAKELFKNGAKLNKKYLALLPRILHLSKEEINKKLYSFKYEFGFIEKFMVEVLKMLKETNYNEYQDSYVELKEFDLDLIQNVMGNEYE